MGIWLSIYQYETIKKIQIMEKAELGTGSNECQ